MAASAMSSREGRLLPRPPFSLAVTAYVLQRRPTNKVDIWDGQAYWRVLELADGPRLVSVRQRGGVEDPELAVTVEDGEADAGVVAQACAMVAWVLGTDLDTATFHAFADADPVLGPIVRPLRGLKPPRFPTLWETLLGVVAFQQISLSAALAIVGRLSARYGVQVEHAGRTFYTYPNAESVRSAGVDALRALGLSVNKAVALSALAGQVGRGDALRDELSQMTSTAAVERLVQLPGIGRWSAEVVLLRGLGRVDVFPGADSGVIRGLADALGRETGLAKGEERVLAERFGDWRGMLYLCVAGFRLLRLGLLPAASSPGNGT